MVPQKCRWWMVQFPTMLDCFECFFDVWIFSVFRFQPWNFAAAYFFGGFTKSHKALRLNPTRGESLFIFRMNFLCFCKAPLNFPNKPYSYQRLRQRKMGYESSWKQGLFRKKKHFAKSAYNNFGEKKIVPKKFMQGRCFAKKSHEVLITILPVSSSRGTKNTVWRPVGFPPGQVAYTLKVGSQT